MTIVDNHLVNLLASRYVIMLRMCCNLSWTSAWLSSPPNFGVSCRQTMQWWQWWRSWWQWWRLWWQWWHSWWQWWRLWWQYAMMMALKMKQLWCEWGAGSELDNQEMINWMTRLSIYSCLSIVQLDDMCLTCKAFARFSTPALPFLSRSMSAWKQYLMTNHENNNNNKTQLQWIN